MKKPEIIGIPTYEITIKEGERVILQLLRPLTSENLETMIADIAYNSKLHECPPPKGNNNQN